MKTSTALMILFGGGQLLLGIFEGYVNWLAFTITIVMIYAVGRMDND